MKSISLKVTIWSVIALALSLAAFINIGDRVIGKTAGQNFAQLNQVLFHQAIEAYRAGGSQGLERYLSELNRRPEFRCRLLDGSGRDLISGEDKAEIVRLVQRDGRVFVKQHNTLTMVLRSGDGGFIWIVSIADPSPILFAPFYLLLLITVAALYWLVTAYITQPVRQLAHVVERFGAGDLSARSLPRSSDEIGNLGRSFNGMADRIETLLTSERQLLQDVSHELRSPLARLTFEAEMVRRTTDRDAAATRLRHEIERLSELVETLIDMARAEGEPGAIQTEELCLNELLMATVEDCDIEAQAAGCRIEVQADPDIRINGEAELLRRAIENVLRNAIRYSPSGAAVEIRLSRLETCVRISVRDYGPGIPEEMKDRIFDPFFRVDSSRDERTGGLGLGLAIARRAVRVHHGDIVASNSHPGAQLSITIPVG